MPKKLALSMWAGPVKVQPSRNSPSHMQAVVRRHSSAEPVRQRSSFLANKLGVWLRMPASRRVALTLCCFAFALRVWIAAHSKGTNDIDVWLRFAKLTQQHGVLAVYGLDSWFNHPPLMGLYAEQMLELSRSLGLDFSFVFKVIPMLASAATVWLVYRLGRLPALWLLLFAINPIDVLISAYHGNTDAIGVMFCVVSVLCADRGRPWLSGLALGAALNVKLIPAILIAPLALSLSGGQLWRFGIGLTVWALPFLPVYMHAWEGFQKNALFYNSFFAPWGVGLVRDMLTGRLAALAQPFGAFAVAVGKPLILLTSALIGVVQWRFRPWTRAELCAIATCTFLAVTPGFGVQYLLWPSAFVAVVSGYRRAYALLYIGGTFIFLVYYGYWTGNLPAFSNFDRGYDLRTIVVGFWTWLHVCGFLGYAARRGLRSLVSAGPIRFARARSVL